MITAVDFVEILLDVIKVEPQKDNMRLLVFENHEKRLFDMNPYLEKNRLRSLNIYLYL